MRLSFRLILALIAGVTAVSLGFALYQAQAEARAQRDEVERHARVLGQSMRTSAESLVLAGAYSDLQAMVDEFQNHERLAGVAVYDQTGMAARHDLEPGVAAHRGPGCRHLGHAIGAGARAVLSSCRATDARL